MRSLATVRCARRARTHRIPLSERSTHELSADRIRRQIGKAWLRVTGTCEEQARALGFADHSRISQFRRGEGAAGNFAVQLVALELAGRSTDALITEILSLRLAARNAALSDGDLEERLRAGLNREHTEEARENRGSAIAAATGCPRALIAGMAPETDCQLEVLALAHLADARGLKVRIA